MSYTKEDIEKASRETPFDFFTNNYLSWNGIRIFMKILRYVIVNLILFSFLFLIVGCAARNENLIASYNEFAIESAKAGLWNEAALRWKRIIEIDPNNAKAHNNLGVAYEALERFDDALREYELAVKLEPANKVYRKNLIRYKEIHRGG